MNLIVAVDNNWAIGNKNQLLVRIPNDMKHFREETTGKVVVLGRKTLETFPQGQPLPKRVNIVLSRDKNYQAKGAVTVHSLEELMAELKNYPPEDIYIIGGDSIYKQLLPYCDSAIVTRSDYVFEADTFFPNLEEDPDWIMTGESEEQTYFSLEYTFQNWERRK